jgi:acetylornithine deacetylase/succinyl-diaminopimelate desuccinylase-like protein
VTDRLARLERTIRECVEDHRAEGVRLLQSFIQSPSYSNEEGTAGDPSSMVGEVCAAARGHGTAVDVQPVGPQSENVIEVLRGAGSRSFVLEAHTDTVPEGDPSGWYQGNPFSGAEGFVEYLGANQIEIDMGDARYRATIRDQMARVWEEKRHDRRRPILYGRGSFDNKGCVLPVVMALQALAEALPAVGETLNGSVIGGYTVDEEAGCAGVRRFACGPDSWLAANGFLDGPVDKAGFLTEISGISLDGSYGWVPVVGHRGSLQLVITVHGLAAHAATPRFGVNAVEQASRLVLHLVDGQEEISRRLLRSLNPSLLGPPTLAIGTTIVGGGVRRVVNAPSGPRVERGGVNTIPNWCETTLDIRFPAGYEYPRDIEAGYELVFETVRDYLTETVTPNGWSYEVRRHEGSGSPPVELGRSFEECANLPIVRRVRERGLQVLGYEPDMEIAPGGTDATLMIHEGHIPTLVEFGPAGGLSHNTHEFVERDDLAAGAAILALLAVDTLGLAE